ncbi:MAG: MG2 domain-containing protein, partial [Chitinophagales bacterium]
MKNFEPGADYASNWKQVEEMESNGRTQDAKKAVEQILAKAEKDNNMQQMVKALLHKYKYSTFVEEGSDSLIVIDLKQQIESAEQPLKSVLQSILAEVYWQYFQNNRYKILNRTNVAKELDDFQTWDTKRLTKEVKDLHLAAIADKELLRQAPLKMFDEVINQQKNARQFRPSLYDFLAHRALDYFTNDQANITTAADQFSLDNPAIFASSTGFAATTFSNTDELSTKYYALTILQDLVRLHIGDKMPEALIDVELKRLNFARKNAALPLKDQLYFQALRSLEEKHESNAASGNVSYEIARFLFDQSTGSGEDAEKTNIFSEMPKKDALDICNKVIEQFPNSQGANNCNALKEQIYHKSLSFQVEQANQPNAPFRTLVNYKNMNKAYGRVVLITPEIEDKASNFNRDDKRWNYYLSLPIVEDWTIELPQVGDYESHAVEMKVPALEVGKYMVMLATDGQFSFKKEGIAYQFTTITDLSIVARFDYAKNGQGYYVLNRQTGQPIQGVSYEAFLRRYENRKSGYVNDLIASGKSDKDGYFVVTKKNNKYNYGNLIIKLKNDKDSFVHNDYLRSNRSNKKLAKDKTFFFTDRAIYRPGQTIYFKGLMLKTDGKTSDLLTSKSSKVELYDVNYQKVSDLQLRTNEFGSFNGKFTLPTGLLNGQMTLRNESGSASIRVEEYKRPKFEVTFEPVQGSYRLNETVKVTGLAKAYAGVNLDGAMVKYRVVRKARFPYWGWWWRPAPSSAEREITNGTATTNTDGTFDISFTAIPDATLNPDDKPQFSYTVYADVTDINGETQSKSTTVQVGYVSLLANIKMSKDLERNGDNSFAVSTTNLGGEFEAAEVSITIHELVAPERIYRTRLWSKADQFVMDEAAYHNDFPNDIYKDENELQNWERGKKVFERSFTTTKSATIELKDLAKWDLGKYVVELKTKDKYGEAVELNNYVTVYDIDEKEIGANDIGSFKLSQTTAEPGDVVTLAYGTVTKESKVLVEVIKDNRILRKDWFDISEGQRITNLKITEMHRGNLDVVVSMVKFNRLLSERFTINVPWSNKELNVEVQTFRNKLYPGAEEEWQLKISGPKGEKVAAEMLASMYDASLDAFANHNWYFDIYPRNATSSTLDPDSGFNGASSNFKSENWNPRNYSKRTQTYDALNWFGFYMGRNYYGGGAYAVKSAPRMARKMKSMAVPAMRDSAAPEVMEMEESAAMAGDMANVELAKKEVVEEQANDSSNEDNEGVQIRKNLQETAFFYPDLRTNAAGEIIISFTAPEALTRWKLMTFSHTRDLKFQQLAQETITQKDLMVLPNIPRFLRENDEIILSSKVSNLTEKMLNGTASLQLFDALTMEPIDKDMANLTAKTNFICPPNQSDVVSWSLKIPET